MSSDEAKRLADKWDRSILWSRASILMLEGSVTYRIAQLHFNNPKLVSRKSGTGIATVELSIEIIASQGFTYNAWAIGFILVVRDNAETAKLSDSNPLNRLREDLKAYGVSGTPKAHEQENDLVPNLRLSSLVVFRQADPAKVEHLAFEPYSPVAFIHGYSLYESFSLLLKDGTYTDILSSFREHGIQGAVFQDPRYLQRFVLQIISASTPSFRDSPLLGDPEKIRVRETNYEFHNDDLQDKRKDI